MLLDAWLELFGEKDKLSVKIAKGLLAHKKKGRWLSTQENCWCLLALEHYFRVFERHEPDYTVRMWLGEQFASEQTFRGRETHTNVLSIPMQYLVSVRIVSSSSLSLLSGSVGPHTCGTVNYSLHRQLTNWCHRDRRLCHSPFRRKERYAPQ